MPAEWWPHLGTWLVWPYNEETWPGRVASVEAAYVRMVQSLAPGELVFVIVPSEAEATRVRGLLNERSVAPMAHVRLLPWPTNDSWVRDTGATFVLRGGAGEGGRERALCGWRFNAWGGKYPPWELDDALPGRMAAWFGEELIEPGVVLEGGSIEVDGVGTVLTTEQCLLNPNRNPGLGRDGVEALLRERLGAGRVLWLGDGIVGDDTDGHIDDIARFTDAATIVCAAEPDTGHPNHAPLADALARLRGFRTAAGSPYRVVELPQPPDVLGPDGEILPASYANFYIANGVVLVPSYDAQADARALEVLAPLFPGRRLVPIPSRDLVLGLGSVHCLTQQVPAR
jgi:agmatine deiminase